MDVKGKVAVVTGASGGIGLATAKLLSKKGAKLALVARSKDKLEAAMPKNCQTQLLFLPIFQKLKMSNA